MIREIQEFLDTYTRDFDRNTELNQSIMGSMDFTSWVQNFADRSEGIRAVYKSNEQNINRLLQFLRKPLTEATANDLFKAVQVLYSGSYDDLYIMQLICEPLIAFYMEKNDVEKLIYLYAVMSFENYEFYGRIPGEKKKIIASTDCYRKVISFAKNYAQISDKSIRDRIVTAYSNMIAPIAQFDEQVRKEIFQIYDEAYELFYQAIEPMGDKTRKEFMGLIDLGMLSLEANLNEMDEKSVLRFTELVKRLEQDPDFEDSDGNLYRAKQSLAVYHKEKTVESVIRDYISYIKALPQPNFAEFDDNTNFRYSINFFNSAWVLFELFDTFQLSKEEELYYTGEFVDDVTNVLTRIPYPFMTSTFNDVCVQWFMRAEKCLPTYEKKQNLLLHMIICRQPATYIHSLMVQKLSLAIAKKMLEKDKTCFDAVGISSREKLLKYIGDCAIMHDIGKCAIADVINKQSRKLQDYEFDIIRMHPEKAIEIINNDPDFMPYMGVMLGHHKSYDGSYGYPNSFANRESDIAMVIDLISVCDAMDAATDIYGRNYTAGKNFDTLYQELVAGKGTRYSSVIVDTITECPDLYDELKNLTENRRDNIYYKVYQEIMSLKSEPS